MLSTLVLSVLPLVGQPSDVSTGPAPSPVVAQADNQASRARTPELFFAFPAEGEFLDPVFLFGSNFGSLPTPWFGIIPSIALFTFETPEIPFFGTLSFSVTSVPIYLFPGVVDLTVTNSAGRSNAVDFRLL